MYALERLTSSKPNWEFAVIYCKGVQPFTIEAKDSANIRWIRDEHLVEIKVNGINNPFDPPREPQPLQDGRIIPGYPGSLVDFVDYVYEEEIARISFFSNTRNVKVNADMPGKSNILTAEGENQATATEYAKGKESMSIVP